VEDRFDFTLLVAITVHLCIEKGEKTACLV